MRSLRHPGRSAAALALLSMAALGCGDDEAVPAPPPEGCSEDSYQQDDGSCAPAGIPADLLCPPAEYQHDDGSCVPAGVPPDGCADGFAHDGDRGCSAISPDTSCPMGQMALPGETQCRELSPCGATSWGAIPGESNTQYVDQSYSGGSSDGTMQAPWTTIGDALTAAAPDAIVAVAAGSYAEDLVIVDRVRLWGRCASMVEVVGSNNAAGAIDIRAGADGTVVRGLAVTAAKTGIVVSGSRDVVLEQLHAHHGGYRGVMVDDYWGESAVTLRDSLLEQNDDAGAFASAATLTIERCVIRDSRVDAQGLFGRGVSAQANLMTGAPSSLDVSATLVERSYDMGLFVEGSSASVRGSVFRDTRENQFDIVRGVNAQAHPTTLEPSTLTLVASVVEDNAGAGIFVGSSHAVIEDTVVRNTRPDSSGEFGRGLNAQAVIGAPYPAIVEIHRSLIDESHDSGIYIEGSDVSVEGTAIRASQSNAAGLLGRGIQTEYGQGDGRPSALELRASLVQESSEAGVAVFGSSATIERSIIRGVSANALSVFGDGLVVMGQANDASATITATRIEQSERAAIASLGSTIALGFSELTCQSHDLVADEYEGRAYRFDDLGANLCGCPDADGRCAASSSVADAPQPIGGLE